jgi:hypothetical protein
MLRAGSQPEQLDKWYQRLTVITARARRRLQGKEPALLAAQSGAKLAAPNTLKLRFLWQDYVIDASDWVVRPEVAGVDPTPFVESMLLSYLASANGTPIAGVWISYHDLPEGMFYAQAFHGYAERRLVQRLSLDAFQRAAEQRDGETLDLGSAGYSWSVLPRVRLAAIYWQGDDEMPSQASLLFDRAAIHYMTTDGLAALGSRVVDALIAV